MDVFQSMRFFVAVAQSGSFTAAAELLDTTTTNVSKAVSAPSVPSSNAIAIFIVFMMFTVSLSGPLQRDCCWPGDDARE